eukprot:1315259-Amorphochlora_amoeboformis.AAC.1
MNPVKTSSNPPFRPSSHICKKFCGKQSPYFALSTADWHSFERRGAKLRNLDGVKVRANGFRFTLVCRLGLAPK